MKNFFKWIWKSNSFLSWLVFTIIFVLFVQFVFYPSIAFALGTEEKPIMAVISNSMNPNLKIGDIVVIKGSDDIKVNDIVVYKKGSMQIVHRVVEITEKGYITKGDNNKVNDPEISKEQVIGKMLFKISYLGYPKILLSEVLK